MNCDGQDGEDDGGDARPPQVALDVEGVRGMLSQLARNSHLIIHISGERSGKKNAMRAARVSERERHREQRDRGTGTETDTHTHTHTRGRLLLRELARSEGLGPPRGVSEVYAPQADASLAFDEAVHAALRPKTFRTAVFYRLGVPVLAKEISCPLCMQTIDVSGDHATCCSKSGDLIVRHNAPNLVNEIAKDGLLSPAGDVTIPL